MELTTEHQKLIEDLLRIRDFNHNFQISKQELDKMLTKVLAANIDLSNREKKLESREEEIEVKSKEKLEQLLKIEKEIRIIIQEKTKSFPWLSFAISDYINLQDNNLAEYLRTKKNPARVASELIKENAIEKKALAQQLILARYRVKYYETLFPFLTEYSEDDIDELLIQVVKDNEPLNSNEEDDPVQQYMTPSEFMALSESERNQMALDRYLISRKTPKQIGRDYERYIGYLYEKQDFEVSYYGITEGLEDLGRDLICKKGDIIEIVQCKCWSSHKQIHEKHINQLFGTTVKYYIDYLSKNVQGSQMAHFPSIIQEEGIKPVFYTSTVLSDTAKKFAVALGVDVYESIPLKPYPTIKCHINKQTGEKIYHLPFDQMYDRTIIEKKFGEFYAMTVKEAETSGFRRAWRWMGNE